MKTLSYGKHIAMFPERMSELDEKQILQLAECFTGNKSLVDAKVWLARLWAPKVFAFNEARIKDTLERISRTDQSSQKEILMERLEDCDMNRYFLSELCNWITEPQTCDRWILSSMNFRKFILWDVTFSGPSLRFGNVQFWEWCRTEEYFTQYIETGSRTAFNKFCACLYHPLKNGKRLPFSDEMVNANHNYFNQLTARDVFAIRLNYIAVKNWIRQVHKHLFKRREEVENADQEDMADLLLRHAEAQKVHYKVVEKDPLLVALKQMNNRAKDAKEAEERNINK
jgi:hypothetical protein